MHKQEHQDMANPNLTMPKLKRAFQLLAANVPQRTICEQLHMGRGVLSKYKQAADKLNLSYDKAGCMNNEELLSFLQSTKPSPPEKNPQRTCLERLIPDYVADLTHNRYLTIQHLHAKYLEEHPNGYGYTQFKKAIRDYQYANNLSYHNTYLPGVELQIDFAGDKLWITDYQTGIRTPVVVLVCILPYSGLGYAKALYNASMESFFGGLSDALNYYGGTPRIAKSDNMKQWVKKHDRYEPVFNDAAIEWAAYYNTTLEACRIRKPRDKGAVEGLVKKVYNAVYAEIRNEVFYTIESLNDRIFALMDIFNSKPSKTTGRSRLAIFESEEKSSLGILPALPFRFRYRKEVKLTSSYHIQIGLHKYSAPYQFVGKQVKVIWDIDTVEIYSDGHRIATHTRKIRQGYSTLEEHMPAKHLSYQRGRGYNAAYFIGQAEKIGPHTKVAIESILKRNKYVEHGYSSCHGIMMLKLTYGEKRLECACKRLSDCSTITYTMIKNVLSKNLDLIHEEKHLLSHTPHNEYVRGADTFNQIIDII